MFLVFASTLMLLMFASTVAAGLAGRKDPGKGPSFTVFRGYRPRPTDAGRWLGATTAVVDKSTCGRLLADRLRREPGLNVVLLPEGGEAHPATLDELYDPELDGRG